MDAVGTEGDDGAIESNEVKELVPASDSGKLTVAESRFLKTHMDTMTNMHETFFKAMDRRVTAFETAFERTNEQHTRILTTMSSMQSQMLGALLKGQERYETLTGQMTHLLATKNTASVLRKKKLGVQVNRETALLRLIMGQTQENCFYTGGVICEKMLLYSGVGLARTGQSRFTLSCGLAYDVGRDQVKPEQLGNKKALLSFAKDDKSIIDVLSSELLGLTAVEPSSHPEHNSFFAKKNAWSSTPNVYWKTGDEFIKNLRDHMIQAYSGKLDSQAIVVMPPSLTPQTKGRGKQKFVSFSACKIAKPNLFGGFIDDKALYDIPYSHQSFKL